MNIYPKILSEDIRKMLEKRLRIEILRARETSLKKELVSVQNEINRLLGAKIEAKPKLMRPPKAAKPVRTMLVEVLKRTKRPMMVKELTKKLLQQGYRSSRKDPNRTVDTTLRANPQLFRKTVPSTFELIG